MINRRSSTKPPRELCQKLIVEAERDYYDCMTRFGHNSAEAHAAQTVYKQLRSSYAQSGGTAG